MSNIEARCFLKNKLKEVRKMMDETKVHTERQILFIFMKDIERTLFLLREMNVGVK